MGKKLTNPSLYAHTNTRTHAQPARHGPLSGGFGGFGAPSSSAAFGLGMTPFGQSSQAGGFGQAAPGFGFGQPRRRPAGMGGACVGAPALPVVRLNT